MLDAVRRSESLFGYGADVRSILHLRQMRAMYMPADWFSDPAWDLLLHLYQAHLDGQEMTVGDLIDQTGLKPTTASRWLDCIANRDWLSRRRCEQDHRRIFVELTPKGATAMDNYFDALRN